MRIEKIKLKQIAVFEDSTIEFPSSPEKDRAEIHIFTGPNGSGKSSILYGLAAAFKSFDDLPHSDGYLYSEEEANIFHGHIPTITDVRTLLIKRCKDFIGTSSLHIKLDVSVIDLVREKQGLHKKRANMSKLETEGYLQFEALSTRKTSFSKEITLKFAAFSYSGYRLVKRENVHFHTEKNLNPLYNALDFFKEDNPDFTLNQWLANNISKRDIAFQQKNDIAAQRYQENLHSIERIISEIIGYEITFSLQLEPLNLVIKTPNAELDFDVLPDGLRSLISWIGDLLMRMDGIKWENDLPITERRFFLFLDEIEVHLHPEWQRKVLPIVQKLFKNAQIFISTHSPFIVNSVDNAWIHEIELEKGIAKVNAPILSNSGDSYMRVLREVFGIKDNFGGETKAHLSQFYDMRNQILASPNGIDTQLEKSFLTISEKLASKSTELNTIIQAEIRQINRIKTTQFSV